MARSRTIGELVEHVRTLKDVFKRGYGLALIENLVEAEGLAKRNATRQFTGRRGRKLSGRLLNAIYSGWEMDSKGNPQGFLGTRGIPYGAVHEFGHDNIRPVRANHLWVKFHGGDADRFRRMTPSDFISAMKESNDFRIFPSRRGNLLAWHVAKLITGGEPRFRLTPLFHLREKVEIKARPYLRPAINEAFDDFGHLAARRMAEELARKR